MAHQRILVTGSSGFLGRNLMVTLRTQEGAEVRGITRDSSPEDLSQGLAWADCIFHLAGVNRPQDPVEFERGNANFTAELCSVLEQRAEKPLVVFASSAQAAADNPYGRSKRGAEKRLEDYAKAGGSAVAIRFKNLFGKWGKPNYNSVVATFCHNITRDLPVTISDPAYEVSLVYVTDAVSALLRCSETPPGRGQYVLDTEGPAGEAIKLGDLEKTLRGFRESRSTLRVPDFSTAFCRRLYATYLSYLPTDSFGYGLDVKHDARGNLAEFLKSPSFGQLFVSRTKPGITRGNHFHHTKVEKFFVVQGEGLIRFRPVGGDGVLEYLVRGEDYRVIDIPPGYTHSIENVGSGEMVVLFWAVEIFDPQAPDTYMVPVLNHTGATL